MSQDAGGQLHNLGPLRQHVDLPGLGGAVHRAAALHRLQDHLRE